MYCLFNLGGFLGKSGEENCIVMFVLSVWWYDDYCLIFYGFICKKRGKSFLLVINIFNLEIVNLNLLNLYD